MHDTSPNKPHRKVISFKATPNTVDALKRAAKASNKSVSAYVDGVILTALDRG